MSRLGLAFRCFFRVLSGKPLPKEAIGYQSSIKELPAHKDNLDKTALAIQLLGLFQKQGRLVDFLQEDIDMYDDSQIGAAVRNIHRDCRKVIFENLNLEPVLKAQEESTVTIEPGFDPFSIRLIGNVTGDPPFTGTLKHHGWRVTKVNLPDISNKRDPSIIAPAEVEIS